jgi:hypothetical protein
MLGMNILLQSTATATMVSPETKFCIICAFIPTLFCFGFLILCINEVQYIGTRLSVCHVKWDCETLASTACIAFATATYNIPLLHNSPKASPDCSFNGRIDPDGAGALVPRQTFFSKMGQNDNPEVGPAPVIFFDSGSK